MIAGNDTPQNGVKKRIRNENRLIANTILVCLVAIVAIAGCVLLLFRYRTVRTREADAQARLSTWEQSGLAYTQADVDALLSAQAEAVKEEAAEEEADMLLSDMQERFAAGESTYSILRSLYPDDIVVLDNNQFYFFPITDELQGNDYAADGFVYTDDGRMEYYDEDGELASHFGIDVSRFQGTIDWEQVAGDGVEYAYIRMGIRGYTEGALTEDSQFENNITGALENDIAVGVYFFTQATSEEEAEEEAMFVLDAIEPYDVTCPVVIDIEDISGNNVRTAGLTAEERTDYCIAFCEKIKEAGYTPMIYGNVKTFFRLLDLSRLEEYDKWFAFFGDNLYYPYACRVWQYTESGTVAGVDGDVDLNISFY